MAPNSLDTLQTVANAQRMSLDYQVQSWIAWKSDKLNEYTHWTGVSNGFWIGKESFEENTWCWSSSNFFANRFEIEQIRSKRLYIITPKEELKLVNFVIGGSWLDYILDRIILKSEESSQSVNCFLSILRIINLNRAQVLSSIFNDLILIWSNFIPILLRILRKYNEFLHFSKVEFWDLSNASNMYLFDLVIISIRFYEYKMEWLVIERLRSNDVCVNRASFDLRKLIRRH